MFFFEFFEVFKSSEFRSVFNRVIFHSLGVFVLLQIYFRRRIDESGRSLGRPALAFSSGDVDFDAAAYTWIVESGLAAGLPAGLFEMSVYP